MLWIVRKPSMLVSVDNLRTATIRCALCASRYSGIERKLPLLFGHECNEYCELHILGLSVTIVDPKQYSWILIISRLLRINSVYNCHSERAKMHSFKSKTQTPPLVTPLPSWHTATRPQLPQALPTNITIAIHQSATCNKSADVTVETDNYFVFFKWSIPSVI